nr:alpha/beta hydrolases superfamily protein [Tanacetum cinerariifolium]
MDATDTNREESRDPYMELTPIASEELTEPLLSNNGDDGTLLVVPESVLAATNAPPVGDELPSNSKEDHSRNSIADVQSDQTRKNGIPLFKRLIERVRRTVRGSVDDIGWLRRAPDMPPVEDGTERFSNILEIIRHDVHMLPNTMVYLLVPGLFSNHGPLYFTTTKAYFSKMGLTCHIAKIHSEASVEKNAREIKEYIEEFHWGSKKRVFLLGHSKGGIDAAAALSMYWPDLKDKVAGLALAQSPYGGSPIASDIMREGQIGIDVRKLMDILICKVIKGDLQALEDLTYKKRKEFLKKHQLPKELPVVSFHTEANISPAALATFTRVAHAELPTFAPLPTPVLPVVIPLGATMVAAAQLLQTRYHEKSDGLVLRRDAEVPGSVVVRPTRKLDHAWMVYSSTKDEPSEADASQKALGALCNRFHIPEEVHPVLPNQNDTMNDRPVGKIGLYTRFFDFANFRLPLSTFLVDVLRHFRINISQLSVTGAAKVSHIKILCRVYGIIPTIGLFRCFYVNSKKSKWMSFSKRSDNASVCYTKPFDSLKNWNDHFFWVDDFACPASFSWHTAKHVIRDPAPVAADFNEQDYATLVAHPFPELDASVERLFDEGSSGNLTDQGDFAGGGRDADIQPVIEVADTVVEDVAPVQLKRQGKRKFLIVDADGASHPPKKLREDHGTPSGTLLSSKSRSALKRLLVGAVLNAKVGVAAMHNLPFMSASISSTPERGGGEHTNSVAGLNLRAIGTPPRFVVSSDSSHHSGTNVAKAEVDSLVRSSIPIMTTVTTITSTVDPASVSKKKLVKPSPFCVDSSSASGTNPTTGVFSNLAGSDFLVGAICTVIDTDTDLQKVYVSQWSVTNRSLLDDGRLFTEFNVGAARQMSSSAREAKSAEVICLRAQASIFEAVEKSLWDEADALKERNVILEKERNALDVKVHELEISSFGLQEKVIVYENCMDQLEKFQDDRMKVVNDKFDKLYTDFVEMALHLEEKFYPHQLTTVSGHSKAIEKGMQDGLSTKIVHGKEGRALTYVVAHNPSAEVDYTFALKQLRNVNFSLLAELISNKEASVKTVMNILRLEGPLAEKLGLNELQPNVDQLMVPIHHSSDKVVLGATALSLALDVTSFRVQRIKENIPNQRSALRDVFVPLAEPFSAAVLTGTKGTSNTTPATANTNTSMSTTFRSVSFINPISLDDYEVVSAEDQAVADENVASFPNVDDVELNIPE